ncbi:hypothetical protein AK812_SmicGene30863 [Symbiodinium microadriaticum]|uniref:Uncharacterized protein n=1 Tax=Symbiodinium microadriaticum TaxID=2951 RepID=A0A1Q9CY56_SYMMI|nr:hypothetical protein AK812_SmicGene30863 [Symbiodinium microadriaticum]CAE7248389.1 unnamed protein product [Symbiodinium microadriaticum]
MATATAATPTENASPATKRKEEAKPQTVLKPENYITFNEWSVLQKGPGSARLETLLRRYLLLGLSSLTEQTVKRGLAMLLALAAPELAQMPTYEEIYEEVQIFKRSWESLNAEADDPPMGKDVKAGIWLFHISMRSASKLLQKNRTGRLPRPDGKAVQQQHADEFQSRMDEALGRLERLLDQGYGQNALQDGDRRQLQLAAGSRSEMSSSAGVSFALGNPAQAVSAAKQAHEGQQAEQTSPRRPSALQLALPAAEAEAAQESAPGENEALFQKLKDRKAGVLKKPAAAAATSGKGNLPKDKSAAAQKKTDGQGQANKHKKGKGKGKGKLSKDKSASHKEEKQEARGSHGKRNFPLVWEDGLSHKNYASRMYKRAGTWAKHQGFSEQQVGDCQREAHREAIILWKKKNGC